MPARTCRCTHGERPPQAVVGVWLIEIRDASITQMARGEKRTYLGISSVVQDGFDELQRLLHLAFEGLLVVGQHLGNERTVT